MVKSSNISSGVDPPHHFDEADYINRDGFNISLLPYLHDLSRSFPFPLPTHNASLMLNSSWFSYRSFSPSTPSSFYCYSSYIPPTKTIKHTKVHNGKEGPSNEMIRSRKIAIRINRILRGHLSLAYYVTRSIYNECVYLCTRATPRHPVDHNDLRKLLIASDYAPWSAEKRALFDRVPADVRHEAIKDFCKAFEITMDKVNRKVIPHFMMHFRSRKYLAQESIVVRGRDFKDVGEGQLQCFPSKWRGGLIKSFSDRLPAAEFITKSVRIIRTKEHKYYIALPLAVKLFPTLSAPKPIIFPSSVPKPIIPTLSIPKRPIIPTSSIPKRPIIPISSIPKRPIIPTSSIPKRPIIPISSIPKRPIIPTSSIPKRPIIHISSIPKRPIIPTSSIPKRPIIPISSIPKRPIIPTSSIPKRPIIPISSIPKRPIIPTSSIPKRPIIHISSIPKRPIISTSSIPKRPIIPISSIPKLQIIPPSSIPKQPIIPHLLASNPIRSISIDTGSPMKSKRKEFEQPMRREKVLRGNAVALDPGVRIFQTTYDTEGNSYLIGENGAKKIDSLAGIARRMRAGIYRYYQNGKKKYRKARNAKEKKGLLKAANRIEQRIKNMISDIHRKTVKFLCEKYDTIIIPEFASQDMVRDVKRKIGKSTARQLLRWSHYKFRELLKCKGEVMGAKVVIGTEEYTSKTCGNCFYVNKHLTGQKTLVCRNCNITIHRDINGARNILMLNWERAQLQGSLHGNPKVLLKL